VGIRITIKNKEMKKIYFFILVLFLLSGCDGYDESYMEGRITTLKITEISNQSAVLNGKIEIVSEGNKVEANVVGRGFYFGTSSNDLKNKVSDKIAGKGTYSCNVDNLLPNTKYYVRAYAIIEYLFNDYDGYNTHDDDNIFYGNIIEFTTEKQI
jgi:hypothetical protein